MKTKFQRLARVFLTPFFVALLAVTTLSVAFAASKRVVFFTAGAKPTAAEQVKIDLLKAEAVAPITLRVVNGARATAGTLTGDYSAGTVPASYRDGGIDGPTTMTYYNPAAPPTLTLPGGGSITIVPPDAATP